MFNMLHFICTFKQFPYKKNVLPPEQQHATLSIDKNVSKKGKKKGGNFRKAFGLSGCTISMTLAPI